MAVCLVYELPLRKVYILGFSVAVDCRVCVHTFNTGTLSREIPPTTHAQL